jgi:hypothetical protein
MNEAGPFIPNPTAHAEFPTTQWPKVLNAGRGGLADAPGASEELCRAY